MTSIIHHALPSEPGDTGWFYHQNKFEQGEIQRQVAYKRRHCPDLADGHSRNRPQHYYPLILPEGSEGLVFYTAFADDVLQYIERERIAMHTELLNLKSSQAACLNFLFPFRKDRVFGTKVLRHFLNGLVSIEDIQFEYTGPEEALPELREMLEDNFLQDEEGCWYVPNPDKQADLEALRQRSLLREFNEYLKGRGRLRAFRSEAVRAGFSHYLKERDYDTILKVADRLQSKVLEEDQQLLICVHNAGLRHSQQPKQPSLL
jgi:hypothetical protein